MSVADRIREETEHSNAGGTDWKDARVGDFVSFVYYEVGCVHRVNCTLSEDVIAAHLDEDLEVMYAQWILERES